MINVPTILPYAAVPTLEVGNETTSRTKLTFNTTPFDPLVVSRLNRRERLVEVEGEGVLDSPGELRQKLGV
jgi:hypothetical protein